MSKLELEIVQEQLGKKKSHLVSQDTVDELNKLAEDPEYGEEFLDSYVSYFNVTEKNNSWSTPKYMNAMKFFTLMEGGHSAVDAYVKVFPDRLASRLERGQGKDDMGGEASRYNASGLVNEIRKVATIPVQLIHRHLLHKAIEQQAHMMMHAKSEMVRQKAGEVLIKELKPIEDTTVNLNIGVDDETKAQQSKLVDHIAQIAINQRQMLAAGMDIADIQRLNVQKSNAIDVEVDEDD